MFAADKEPREGRPGMSAAFKLRLAGRMALGSMLIAAMHAHAAEHITLRNGFELTCDHRGVPSVAEDTSDGSTVSHGAGTETEAGKLRLRLYLDAAEANYLDVAAEEIVAAEALPAAPASVAPSRRPVAKTELSPAGLSAAELHELLASAGAEHDLDVDLLGSLVHAESNSQAGAVSRTGAQGLMQLMPATAAQLGVKDSFVPEANVHGGTAYLDSLLKRYHDNLRWRWRLTTLGRARSIATMAYLPTERRGRMWPVSSTSLTSVTRRARLLPRWLWLVKKRVALPFRGLKNDPICPDLSR